MYDRDFEMKFPPINTPLVLFKFVKELAVPREYQRYLTIKLLTFKLVDIYFAVRQLSQLLNYSFAFLPSQSRHHITANPEIQLISLVIIVAKLLRPFDSIERYPRLATEPTVLDIDWDYWRTSVGCNLGFDYSGGHLGPEKAINIKEKDVMDMSGSQIDDYLDWYEKTYTDDVDSKGKPIHLN